MRFVQVKAKRGLLRTPLWVSTMICAIALSTPAMAGPPFMTDDPDPTPERTFEIFAFANNTTARDDASGSVGLDFNYGAGRDLQLSATLPLSYEQARGARLSSGLGNIELAAKYRILHQDRFGWDVAVFQRVFLPSGSGLGEQHASFLLPVWIGRHGDTWSTFGGGGCALNRGGESQDYCIAGWAMTHRVAPGLQLGGELFHQSPDTKSARASTILGFGATYDANEHLHLLGYIGAGLQNASETGRASSYASLLFTF